MKRVQSRVRMAEAMASYSAMPVADEVRVVDIAGDGRANNEFVKSAPKLFCAPSGAGLSM